MIIPIKKLHSSVKREPMYANPGDSGFDLIAAIDDEMVIFPGSHVLVPTGLAFELPHNVELQVRPRSGLSAKYGVTAMFGTVDQGYRGEVSVVLFNFGNCPFYVTQGMKIAQGVIAPVVRVGFRFSDYILDSARGENGFGSSGL